MRAGDRAVRPLKLVARLAFVGAVFYILLIDTTDLPELYVLAGVAVSCAIGYVLAQEQGFTEARVLPWWLLAAWRVVLRIPLDITPLCWDALAQLVAPRAARGTFRAVRFDAVQASADHAGRRALSEWLGSVASSVRACTT